MSDLVNAKNEFLQHLIKEAKGNLVCAKIIKQNSFDKLDNIYLLNVNFTSNELNNFLESLDFNYDASYGSQALYGVILFTESYSTRYEYDGSEWWINHVMPTVEQVMNFKI